MKGNSECRFDRLAGAGTGTEDELCAFEQRRRPDESLGVIALGIKHANLIDDAVTAALRGAPDVADFFDPDRDERFFVKNLERVQGDERHH